MRASYPNPWTTQGKSTRTHGRPKGRAREAPSPYPLETIVISDDHPDQPVRIGTNLAPPDRTRLLDFLRDNSDCFAWSNADVLGIDPRVITHHLGITPDARPIRQKRRPYDNARYSAMKDEVQRLKMVGFIREVDYPRWACPKDSFPLPRIDQLVDATAGFALLSFLDAYSGYN
ncbi:unnamed protein product [Prunus brigantina]